MSEDDSGRKQRINVEVDTANTERLAAECQRLKDEKEQREKQDLNEHKLQAFEKFHNENFLKARTNSELATMLEDHINKVAEQGNPHPSGSARCDTPQQMGEHEEDIYHRKWDSFEQMFTYLREHQDQPNNKSYLDKITENYLAWKRANPTVPEQNYNPNSPENMPDLVRTPEGYVTTKNKDESEIGRLQASWRRARLRQMGVKEEDQK